jgi:FkbM family methyltransferase
MRFIIKLATVLRILKTLGIRGSVQFLLARLRTGLHSIPVRRLKRSIWVRGRTSDLWVLNTVIACEEYRGFISTPPRTIIDAGANIGCASVYWKSRFPNASIVALEPDPENHSIALKNVEGLADVVVLKAGLWSSRTRLRITNPDAWKYAIRVEECESGGIQSESVESILSSFAWPQVDVLKMDIEGSEVEVLSNNIDGWIHRVNTLIIELHQDIAPGGARALCAALAKEDFRISWRGEDLVATRIHPLRWLGD